MVDFHVRVRIPVKRATHSGNKKPPGGWSNPDTATIAGWHDLNHLAAGPEALTFVSLFDDTADVWADEDFRLVEPLSMVSRWSRPDELAAVLSGAA